jgi:hypothetical protein
MDEFFRFDSDYCPSVATAPTILMPSALDTKNQSNMRILSECHLTLFDIVDCIVNPLHLKDLPIVGQSDKKAKAMMHGDEGIGVDGLKELDPGPYTHDGIPVDDIMAVPFTMNLYLHCLSCLTMSFLLSSKDIRPFLF